jgi:hypothetical protein
MKSWSVIISCVLLAQTVWSWACFSKARSLPYDENYGAIIFAFMISLFIVVIGVIIRVFVPRIISTNIKIIVIWLIVGSPLTFLIALYFYYDLFGTLAT